MVFLESEVKPMNCSPHVEHKPWRPNVEWGDGIKIDVASTISILPAEQPLGGEDGNSKPSVATFNWSMLSFHGVPGPCVFECLSEADCPNSKPHEQSQHGEWVYWWNHKVVDLEESSQEEAMVNELHVHHNAHSLVTVPDVPIIPVFLAFFAQEVILHETISLLDVESKGDGWDVAKQNVHDEVVPPALSEVRKDMLPAQLNDLVKNVKEVEQPEISYNE